MVTRRGLLGAGLVVATGAALPRWLSPARDPVRALAATAPLYLGLPVSLKVYEDYFRIRLERLPDRRDAYEGAAAASEKALLGPDYEWLRREVLEHFSRTEAWTRLGYPAWPGQAT